MEMKDTQSSQRGFFDAGIGLALLAVFSLMAATVVQTNSSDARQHVTSTTVAIESGE